VGETKASEKILPFLTGMRELHLDRLPITDAGLKAFHAAKQLKNVSLTKTKVTAEGVRALQKALPGCKIEVDFPVSAFPPLDPAKATLQGHTQGNHKGEIIRGRGSGEYRGATPTSSSGWLRPVLECAEL
jgi:hypothetical protein